MAPHEPSTEMVTFSLNGASVTVPKGTKVIQAAAQNGVAIPHFCWHEGLSVAGACRFCMVEVEGRPKLEISCNLEATEGMMVRSDSAKAKEAHKWALEFHLVNHPLDCPICDQAGECGLQDYYMEVGRYSSQMTRRKVLKPKALDVGGDLVLDTERCILCTRCVRFEEEITKTNALGIFDRGDRSIIGIYPGHKIDHQYTTNLVDICPVGAFTSKNFRFKQRVWFLEDKEAVCPGCSTGCHVTVSGKPATGQYFRIKPRASDVNGHWMCDYGRELYQTLDPATRLREPMIKGKAGDPVKATLSEAVSHLGEQISAHTPEEIALLVSPQYTNEEYRSLLQFFVETVGVRTVCQWRDPAESLDRFDGILLRGDRNPNTAGLRSALREFGFEGVIKNEFDELPHSQPKVVIALAPEMPESFPSLADNLQKLWELPYVSLWTVLGSTAKMGGFHSLIPMQGFCEKTGSYTNHAGDKSPLEDPFSTPFGHSVEEVVRLLDDHLTESSGGE